MDINVKGCFICSQAAIPDLRRDNGAIVMTASESGLADPARKFMTGAPLSVDGVATACRWPTGPPRT